VVPANCPNAFSSRGVMQMDAIDRQNSADLPVNRARRLLTVVRLRG
jgi:hypothetical protein